MAGTITNEELDAYNVRLRQLGAEAARLNARKEAACKAIYASKGFIAHRFATARHLIAVERCDAAFNMRVWGHDSGRADRRRALGERIATLRMQIARSRAEAAERAAAALPAFLMAAE